MSVMTASMHQALRLGFPRAVRKLRHRKGINICPDSDDLSSRLLSLNGGNDTGFTGFFIGYTQLIQIFHDFFLSMIFLPGQLRMLMKIPAKLHQLFLKIFRHICLNIFLTICLNFCMSFCVDICLDIRFVIYFLMIIHCFCLRP